MSESDTTSDIEVVDARDANDKNAKFSDALNEKLEIAANYAYGSIRNFFDTYWEDVLDAAKQDGVTEEDCKGEFRYLLRGKLTKDQIYYLFNREERKLSEKQRRLEQKQLLEVAKQQEQLRNSRHVAKSEQQDDVTILDDVEDNNDQQPVISDDAERDAERDSERDSEDMTGCNVATSIQTSVQQPEQNSAPQPKSKQKLEELSQDAEYWKAQYDDLANSIEGKDIEHWNNRFGEQVKILEEYKQKFADNYQIQFFELATENDFLRKRHHQNEDCYRLLLKLYDNPDSSDALVAAVMKDFVKSWYPNYGAEIRKELEQKPEYLDLKEYGIIETKAKEKHDLELKRKEATEYVRQQKAAKEKKSKFESQEQNKQKARSKSRITKAKKLKK